MAIHQCVLFYAWTIIHLTIWHTISGNHDKESQHNWISFDSISLMANGLILELVSSMWDINPMQCQLSIKGKKNYGKLPLFFFLYHCHFLGIGRFQVSCSNKTLFLEFMSFWCHQWLGLFLERKEMKKHIFTGLPKLHLAWIYYGERQGRRRPPFARVIVDEILKIWINLISA